MRKHKDMASLKEADVAKKQRDNKFGFLRDYSMKHRVTMFWDLNKDSKRDQMFKLRIDDLEVILDAEQVQRLVRWV